MKSQVVAKILIVNEKNEVLGLRRNKDDYRRPGQWDFPGGWVDEGEDLVAAAIREAEEESGIRLKNPQLVFGFSEANPEWGNCTWLVFVEHIQRSPKVRLSTEHETYAWKQLSDLLKNITYDRQQKMLRYVLDNHLL